MKQKTSDRKKVESFCCYAFHLLAIILFGVLFLNGLSVTGQNHAGNEYIDLRKDSILRNLFSLCIALLCLCFLGKIAEKMQSRKVRNIALAVVCFLTAGISIYWVSVCNTAPEADQMMICQFADAFLLGDFSGLRKGGYIARYPQQLGMVTLLRVLFSIFGLLCYQAFQYLMAAIVPLIVLFGCNIVRLLSNDNAKAEVFYLFFSLTCFPMYIYTAFVYGDLIATAFGLLGIWMYLAYLKKGSWIRLLLFGLSMGIAVQLRANLIILAIAMAIVMLIKLIVNRNRQSLAAIGALITGIVLTYSLLWGSYRNVMEEKAPSIPPLLFIAMGLNDTDGNPGWYNGYNYIVFAEAQDDSQTANAIAWERLQEHFQQYRQDPLYMLDFFRRKMNAQWNTPMYQCIAMNRNLAGPQESKLARDITDYGRTAQLAEAWMKLYQLLMYGGILFYLVAGRKSLRKLENDTLLIAVFGGFLFSLIWEAKTRYVLPFLFFQIPYMAISVSMLAALPERLVHRLQNKTERELLLTAFSTKTRTVIQEVRSLMKKNYITILCMAILAVHMAFLLFYGTQKDGFHEDEYYSYYTSAGYLDINPYGAITEKSGYDVQRQFLVTDAHRFDYKNVIEAQVQDVHPPLYYLTLNTFMSLFPNRFYKWFGIGLNTVYSLISCAGILMLILKLDRSRHRYLLAAIAGLAYAVSPAMISNVMLTRMYAMSAMWTVLYANVFVALMQNLQGTRRKFIVTTAAGAAVCYLSFLTHYFCLITAFFLTLGYCIYVLVRRRGIVRMLGYGIAMVLSIGLAVLTFPASITHIFSGYRGKGALDTLLSIHIFDRLPMSVPVLNTYFFGGLMPLALVLLVLSVVTGIVFRRRQKKDTPPSYIWSLAILLSGGLLSAWVLSRVSLVVGAASSRFFYPVAAVLLPVMAYCVSKAVLLVWTKWQGGKMHWLAVLLASAAALVCNISGIARGNVFFLYQEKESNIAFSRENAQYPVVVVFGSDTPYRAWYTANELWPFETVLFIDYRGGNYILDNSHLKTAEKLIVYMDCPETLLEDLIAQNENLNTYSLVRHDPFFYVYEIE